MSARRIQTGTQRSETSTRKMKSSVPTMQTLTTTHVVQETGNFGSRISIRSGRRNLIGS